MFLTMSDSALKFLTVCSSLVMMGGGREGLQIIFANDISCTERESGNWQIWPSWQKGILHSPWRVGKNEDVGWGGGGVD